MAYRIEFAPAASKQLGKLPFLVQRRIAKKIEALSSDPFPPRHKKLSGQESMYRIRIGDYRVVYQADTDILLILVLRVGDRKDIYDDL